MRFIKVLSSIACSVVLISTNLVFAESAAVYTMADITMNLNHFPSDSDKEKLAAIVSSDDSSESEKVVAAAILNIEHKWRQPIKKNSMRSSGTIRRRPSCVQWQASWLRSCTRQLNQI